MKEIKRETIRSYLKRKGVNGDNTEEPTEYATVEIEVKDESIPSSIS